MAGVESDQDVIASSLKAHMPRQIQHRASRTIREEPLDLHPVTELESRQVPLHPLDRQANELTLKRLGLAQEPFPMDRQMAVLGLDHPFPIALSRL